MEMRDYDAVNAGGRQTLRDLSTLVPLQSTLDYPTFLPCYAQADIARSERQSHVGASSDGVGGTPLLGREPCAGRGSDTWYHIFTPGSWRDYRMARMQAWCWQEEALWCHDLLTLRVTVRLRLDTRREM